MTYQKIPFTRAFYENMLAEMARLASLREEVIIRLKAAREMGDLSENGAYKYAKFELADIGRNTRRLKHLTENGEIVETKNSDGTIGFGNTVTVKSKLGTLTFSLVSEYESDPSKHTLSLKSPIGMAVRGKREGDVVIAQIPAGETEYTIEKVV